MVLVYNMSKISSPREGVGNERGGRCRNALLGIYYLPGTVMGFIDSGIC